MSIGNVVVRGCFAYVYDEKGRQVSIISAGGTSPGDGLAQALNAAQASHIIADTEEPVHDATAAFRERVYEKAIRLLQKQQEAFSPSARRTAE